MNLILLISLFFSFSARGFSIPLEAQKWQILKYSSLPANQVSNKEKRLVIKVDKSASPLIYSLPKPSLVKSAKIRLKIKGSIPLDGLSQGKKGADDFLFRFGVVYEGEKTLNFFQRAVAPDWIKRLHSLGGKAKGVSHIQFFNLVSQKFLLGKKRLHPLTDLMQENFISLYKDQNEEFEFKIPQRMFDNKRVLALWISIDGDDTGATFSVELSKIDIEI